MGPATRLLGAARRLSLVTAGLLQHLQRRSRIFKTGPMHIKGACGGISYQLFRRNASHFIGNYLWIRTQYLELVSHEPLSALDDACG
jgi:hypothetical protein